MYSYGQVSLCIIPFNLKNASATFQHTMIVIFQDMLCDCIEDYDYDIVVKSREISWHIDDKNRVFLRCRCYNLIMNLLKCAFGISSGKFLGFVVHLK